MVRDKTLDRALDRLRKPGAALVLTYNRNTVSGRSFHIQPDGVRIADETAQKLLEHPSQGKLADSQQGIQALVSARLL